MSKSQLIIFSQALPTNGRITFHKLEGVKILFNNIMVEHSCFVATQSWYRPQRPHRSEGSKLHDLRLYLFHRFPFALSTGSIIFTNMKSEVQWNMYLMYLIEVHFEVHSEVHPIVWPTWSPTVSKMRYHLESILNFKFKNFFHLFSFSISNFLSMLISTFTS